MSGGQAALALWVDIDPADDTLFEHWHSREHVQERVGCPGWLRGSRYKGVDMPGRYFLLYDAETAGAFETAEYYARLGDPTEMSRVVIATTVVPRPRASAITCRLSSPASRARLPAQAAAGRAGPCRPSSSW